MSKLVSSEFQSWESLYWPEGVPRSVDASLPPPGEVLNRRWALVLEGGEVPMEDLAAAVEGLASGGARCISLTGDGQLAAALGVLLVASGKASAELPRGAPSCEAVASVGLEGGRVKAQASGGPSSWSPPTKDKQYLAISTPEGRRAIYTAEALWGSAASLSAFLGLGREDGVLVLGDPRGEFELSALAASLSSGVKAIYARAGGSAGRRAAFVGGSALKDAGNLPRGASYVGVEGPLDAAVTRGLEKSLEVPVLQMYGISGRGILFSNTIEFNVHGSVGIAITNVEAVVSEVLEASWYRGRRLLGPGDVGEIAVRAPFIDMGFNAGDQRQRQIQVRVSGKNQPWLGVGVMGHMDENGYMYPEGRSFI